MPNQLPTGNFLDNEKAAGLLRLFFKLWRGCCCHFVSELIQLDQDGTRWIGKLPRQDPADGWLLYADTSSDRIL